MFLLSFLLESACVKEEEEEVEAGEERGVAEDGRRCDGPFDELNCKV